MLMRICGSVLKGTLLKTRGLKRGLKWNRHTRFISLTRFPAQFSIFLLEMFLNYPAGVHGVPQAYLHETGWFIQDFGAAGHGGWLPEPVSFQLPDSQDWKGDAHVCKRPSLLKPNWGLFFRNVTIRKFLIPGGAVRRRGFCALFSLPALPHRVWFALAQLSVGAVGSGFYFLEECAVYWNVFLCKSWVVGAAP